MRGKVFKHRDALGEVRITPAYAGKSWNSRWNLPCCKDHPRICGEKWLNCSRFSFIMGSPPHMRGKACFLRFLKLPHRITPAYAGKSHEVRHCWHTGRDHPRICGEKTKTKSPAGKSEGSPPHMRGKVRQNRNEIYGYGITPAYAGKRSSMLFSASAFWDHPRICGEKTKKIP